MKEKLTEMYESYYTSSKTYFFSECLLRLYLVDVWDVRLRLGMLKFSPEYVISLL